MPTYIPNAEQPTEPTESRTVESAALEFRTLKSSVIGRLATLSAELDAEEYARVAGDAEVTQILGDRLTSVEGALSVIGSGGLSGAKFIQRFTGDGSTTSFALISSPVSVVAVDVYIGGVYQQKNSYTLAGAPSVAIVFSEAPPAPLSAGEQNIEVIVSDVVGHGDYPISVKDFGAVGDGVTDDTAAINAALDYLRSLPTGGGGTTNQNFQAIELVFPPAKYRCNASLNFTGIRNNRTFVEMAGSMIVSFATGKTAVDFLHSSNCVVNGLTVWGASTSVPLQGLQIGRRQFDETAANMQFVNLTVSGHFSRASMYNYGAENLRMEHPRLLNAIPSGAARCLIAVGNTDEYAPVTDFQTLGTLGACSFLDNLWTRLDARKYVSGSAVTLTRTSGHKFIKAYAISYDDAPWELVNDGFGHINLGIDAHIETIPVPYAFRFRHTTGGAGTFIMKNFRWEESNSQAATAIFYAETSVTRVLFHVADVVITGLNQIPTDGMFSPVSKFRYWGKLSLPGTENIAGLNIDQFNGALFVNDQTSLTPPTAGTFTITDRQADTPETQHGPQVIKGPVTHETSEVWPTGTFTPTLTFATPGDLSVAYTVQVGNYVKIGRMVLFQMRLSCTPTFTTASGELRIGGLPFVALSGAHTQSSFPVSEIGAGFTWPASRTAVVAQGVPSATYLILRGVGSAAAPTNFTIDHAPSGSVKQLTIAGVYYSNT